MRQTNAAAPSYCSPKVGTKRASCYTRTLLLRLAELYNEAHANKVDLTMTDKKLWKAMHERLVDVCGDDESCWIEQPFVKGTVARRLQGQFKPKKPASWEKNPTEWLNTNDIQAVMQQYEESDKAYRFVGVFPIDFAARTSTGACVSQEMCHLDLAEEWKNGKRKLGVIFNTDKSTGPGMHWISLFIGLDPRRKNYGVFFYDSVATKPPKQLAVYMKSLHAQLKAFHAKDGKVAKRAPELRVNTLRRQFKGYNCGVFSIVFQVFMLRYAFDKVCKMMGYDDDVQRYRDTLYRRA